MVSERFEGAGGEEPAFDVFFDVANEMAAQVGGGLAGPRPFRQLPDGGLHHLQRDVARLLVDPQFRQKAGEPDSPKLKYVTEAQT